jgi:hypothetical protein
MEARSPARIVVYRHSAKGLRSLHQRLSKLEEERPKPDKASLLANPWLVLGLGLLPSLTIIWATPWFATQDGPAHLYSASLLLDSLRGALGPAQSSVFEVRWRPLPNWGGHLVLIGLLSVFPPWIADRLMTTITLAAIPIAGIWTRGQVWGRRGQSTAALGFAVLGMSFPWLLGFGAFVLGLSLGLITLGIAWRWRDRMDWRRTVALAGLLLAGYLGHLVSLGLTAAGLFMLALLPKPGEEPDRRRIGRTLASLTILLPLGFLYRSLTAGSSGLSPEWEHLTSWTDPSAWTRQLGWADPITIGRRTLPPLLGVQPSIIWLALAPVAWLAAGLFLSGRRPPARQWILLGSAMLAGSLVGPDNFGPDHGHYLPQRLSLFGLAALLIGLDFGVRVRSRSAAMFAVALTLQSATLFGYAAESSTRVGAIMEAKSAAGRDMRIGTLLNDIGGRYRANPLLHADCWLGLETGHVIWANYETRFYYFPLGVKRDIDTPPALEFEEAAIRDSPEDRDRRASRWKRLLDTHAQSIDLLICYGRDPVLDAANARWFSPTPVFEDGPVRMLRRNDFELAAIPPVR